VALILVFIGFIGIGLDSYSYISTNILLLFSSLLTLSFIIQTVLAAIHFQGIYTIITSIFSMIISIG